jgi:hypothetical protein
MIFVRVLEAGVWRSAPIGPDCEFEKTLVMSRVVGLWKVNHKPVDVVPGLIVSFLEPGDAHFFKSADVGGMPFVEAGEVVAFECDDDAMHYVTQGLAERLSDEEAKPLLDAAGDQLAKKRDEMLRSDSKTKRRSPNFSSGPWCR